MNNIPNQNITLVNELNFNEQIINFINNNAININTYDDMKNLYLKMLENNFSFILNHELKLHMLIELTYTMCPGEENRNNVLECLDIDSDVEDIEDSIGIVHTN
tara:strand:- start:400 stop:711 length:312 start_codon:yes stop_codon:yes gene_type:complete